MENVCYDVWVNNVKRIFRWNIRWYKDLWYSCLYNTNKRELIALVDTRKSSIVGTVELVGSRPITAEEYCKWHATSKWAGMQIQVEDINATYWAYGFINPRRLDKPIKIKKTGRVWINIDDSIWKETYDFNSLLKTKWYDYYIRKV